MSKSKVFLIDLYKDTSDDIVDSIYVRVGAVVWPFARRLWMQRNGNTEMPGDLRPLLVLRPHQSAPVQEAPPVMPLESDVATDRWCLVPRTQPLYPVVEFTMDTFDEILSHGFYRTHDVFEQPLTFLTAALCEKGDLRCKPGRYFYDVLLVSLRDREEREGTLRRESEAFAKGSFELPLIDNEEPMLDFERLDDAPLVPVRKSHPLFVVTGKNNIGDTSFASRAWKDLALSLPMSLDKEIGGYLVGTVGEGDNGDESVTIRQAIPAELAAGDAHTLLLSPESGADVRQKIHSEWPDQELVGWYHTHIFSSGNDVLSGLSPTDEKTHDEQFTRSWQVAVLVNVWREGDTVSRQVRIFRRNGEGKLVDVDYSVVEGDNP